MAQFCASQEQVAMDDRYKLQLFREQRNWWISLTNFILWMICWRVSGIMKRKNFPNAAGEVTPKSHAAVVDPTPSVDPATVEGGVSVMPTKPESQVEMVERKKAK